jgi:hypothetical protein
MGMIFWDMNLDVEVFFFDTTGGMHLPGLFYPVNRG